MLDRDARNVGVSGLVRPVDDHALLQSGIDLVPRMQLDGARQFVDRLLASIYLEVRQLASEWSDMKQDRTQAL